MKRINVVLALLFLAFTMNAQIETAKGLITNENYAEARKVLNQYLTTEKDPLKQAEAYYWLGECDYTELVMDKNSSKEDKAKGMMLARDNYNKGLTIAKTSPHCQVGMGKLLLDAKNGKEALKIFESAVRDSRKKPYKEGHPEIYVLIGDAYLYSTNKNAEQAVANYSRARDIEPKDAKNLIKLGDGNLAKGDAGGAMSAYESAAMKDKTNADLYLKMSRIWKRASKMDLAQEQLIQGLKVNDQFAPIYKDLIELYMDTKQFDKVLPTLEKYIPLAGGKDPGARRRLVTFLTYQAKDYDRAVVEAEKLLKDDPTQTTMYRWIAWAKSAKADALFEKNKQVLGDDAKMLYMESREASKKLFELVPADRLVYYDYEFPAKAALKSGDLDEATRLYKKVIELDTSKRCDMYANLIQANYSAKKNIEAFGLLNEKEAAGCPIDKNRDYYLAMYYAYYGQLYKESIEFADKYITHQQDITDGYYFKGLSLTEMDSDTTPTWMARETYEKLITVYETKPKERSKTHMTKALMYLAYYFGSLSDFVKAKEYAQKVLVVEPTHAAATKLIADLEGK